VLGLGAAVVIAVVLVAPVALRGGGSTCAQRLAYAGGTYTARPVPADAFVQAEAIGTGVVSGCGAATANVDIRTVEGVSPAVAVALPTETATLYVREGRCTKKATLVACLRKSP
jgi:hypothetical protein